MVRIFKFIFLIVLLTGLVFASEPIPHSLNFTLKEGESEMFNDQNVKITLVKINSQNYNNGVVIYPERSVTLKISQIELTSYMEGEIIVNFKGQSPLGLTSEMEDFLEENNLKVIKQLPTIDIYLKPVSVVVAVPRGEEAKYFEILEESFLVKEVLYSKFKEVNVTWMLSSPEVEYMGIKFGLLEIEEDSASFNVDFEDFNPIFYQESPNILQKFFHWMRNLFD